MKQASNLLKLMAILNQKGFVITEKKPKLKDGKISKSAVYLIEPIVIVG
tara:strand:+ start:390 stop:536 length:147 start_codon:yes stop_codon:yes gene_type:complete